MTLWYIRISWGLWVQ